MEPVPVGESGPLTREELVTGRGGLHVRGKEVGASGELHQTVFDGGAALVLDLLQFLTWFDRIMARVGRQ